MAAASTPPGSIRGTGPRSSPTPRSRTAFGPNGVPGPATNFEGKPAPEIGVIVQWNGSHWLDTIGRSWDSLVKFSLPDKDVFVIDANANPPQQLAARAVLQERRHDPLLDGREPGERQGLRRQHRREEPRALRGPGDFAGETLRGHLHESNITVLTPGGGVAVRHLKKHINYNSCCAPIPNAENSKSLALPQQMAVTSNGQTLYVAALGSDKIGTFSTAQLENNTFVPNAGSHISVSGGGPTGLVLDEDRKQIYVLTRFDNANLDHQHDDEEQRPAHVPMYNPEPAERRERTSLPLRRLVLIEPRRFGVRELPRSSATWTDLAWNLGNPDELHRAQITPGPFRSALYDDLVTGRQPIVDPDLPSDEGSDDDAEPARHGQPRSRCTGAATAPVATRRRTSSRTAARSTSTRRS